MFKRKKKQSWITLWQEIAQLHTRVCKCHFLESLACFTFLASKTTWLVFRTELVPAPRSIRIDDVTGNSFQVSWTQPGDGVELYKLTWRPFGGGDAKEVRNIILCINEHVRKICKYFCRSIVISINNHQNSWSIQICCQWCGDSHSSL